MGDMILGGFDVVGDDMDGDDMDGDMVLGARGRIMRRRGGKVKVPTPRWMNATTSQGVSRPQEELDFLPFEAVTIPAEAALAGATGVLIARPQRPFRGERLVLGARVTAGDFSSALVIDPAIFVGAVQVGAAQGGAPFSAFAATAFGVRLSMPAAGQGTDIKIFFRLLSTTSGGDVALSGVLFGRAMR
jgi:hypothetical protein